MVIVHRSDRYLSRRTFRRDRIPEMMRFLLVAGGLALAAFAIWHPAAAPGVAYSAIPAATPERSPKRESSGAPVQAAAEVYVVGAVSHPGIYRVAAGARIGDAIARAGGLLPSADAAGVDLAAHVSDGDEIDVPRIGEEAPLPRRGRPASHRRIRRAHRAKKTPSVVDVNSAGATALAQVPGIGATIAQRIVDVRERDGPFASYDELLDVAGMTPQRLARAQSFLLLRAP